MVPPLESTGFARRPTDPAQLPAWFLAASLLLEQTRGHRPDPALLAEWPRPEDHETCCRVLRRLALVVCRHRALPTPSIASMGWRRGNRLRRLLAHHGPFLLHHRWGDLPCGLTNLSPSARPPTGHGTVLIQAIDHAGRCRLLDPITEAQGITSLPRLLSAIRAWERTPGAMTIAYDWAGRG